MKYDDSPDDWYPYDGDASNPTRSDGTPMHTLLEVHDVRFAVRGEPDYIIEVGVIHDSETTTNVLIAPSGCGGIDMTPTEARALARVLTLYAEHAEGMPLPEVTA